MSSRSIRQNIFFQILCWTLAAYLYLSCRIIGLAEYDHIQVIIPIRYLLSFVQGTLAGIVIGLILGTVDIFLQRSALRKRSFGSLVIAKGLIYLGTIIFILSIIHLATSFFVDHSSIRISFSKLLQFYRQNFLTSILIYALFISFLVSFIKQVNQKFGPGILAPMMLGKYFKPKQEERIFMFLDLRDSTTHAEKIGHVMFSEMIQDCFYDLATQIEKHRAEIYQYVGDEAVLTWKMKNGLMNHNCLNTFFAFENQLKSRAEHYRGKYGVVPEFKAGVSSGQVMVAEVGEIKKEIAYHGDVLNTGARIQGLCNRFKKNLLISENLKNSFLSLEIFSVTNLGAIELKGKTELVNVWSVEGK